MIKELLRKYASVSKIPEGELNACGYERVNIDGCASLHRIGEPPIRTREELICAIHGLSPQDLPSTMTPNTLLRLECIAEKLHCDPNTGERIADYRGSEWFGYVKAWAKGQDRAIDFMASYLPHRIFAEKFDRLGLNFALWCSGIEPYELEVTTGKVMNQGERLEKLFAELRQAFTDLIENDLANPQACLKELKDKVGAKSATTEDILAAVKGNEDKIRTLLTISLQRANRKGACAGESTSLFHLNSVRTKLVRRTGSATGTFTVRLSCKNPFTDLTLGNDAGCCIGIYLKSAVFGEGYGADNIPRYFLNSAVQFVELWRGRERCGLAMLFAGQDKNGKPILAVNSIELNAQLEDVADQVTDAMVCWIMEFAQAVGFAQTGMGEHDYNTAQNHGLNSNLEDMGCIQGARLLECIGKDNDLLLNLLHSDILNDFNGIDTLSVLQNPRDHAHPVNFEDRDPKSVSFKQAFDELMRFLHQNYEIVVGPEEYSREGMNADPRRFLKSKSSGPVLDLLKLFRKDVAEEHSPESLSENGKILDIVCLIPGRHIDHCRRKTYRWDDIKEVIGKLKVIYDDDLGACIFKYPLVQSTFSEAFDMGEFMERMIAMFWAEKLGYRMGERREPSQYITRKSIMDTNFRLRPCTIHYRDGVATIHGGHYNLTAVDGSFSLLP